MLTYKGWKRAGKVDRLLQVVVVVVVVAVVAAQPAMSELLDRLTLSEIQREQK